MRELVRTQDVVLISFVRALLSDEGIEAVVMDDDTAVVYGSLGIAERRIMVLDEDYSRARRLLEDSGHGAYCRD